MTDSAPPDQGTPQPGHRLVANLLLTVGVVGANALILPLLLSICVRLSGRVLPFALPWTTLIGLAIAGVAWIVVVLWLIRRSHPAYATAFANTSAYPDVRTLDNQVVSVTIGHNLPLSVNGRLAFALMATLAYLAGGWWIGSQIDIPTNWSLNIVVPTAWFIGAILCFTGMAEMPFAGCWEANLASGRLSWRFRYLPLDISVASLSEARVVVLHDQESFTKGFRRHEFWRLALLLESGKAVHLSDVEHVDRNKHLEATGKQIAQRLRLPFLTLPTGASFREALNAAASVNPH